MSYRFFIERGSSEKDLSRDDFFHLTKVLRIKVGETYEVVRDQELSKFKVLTTFPFSAELVEKKPLLPEKGPAITLLYALPKGDKLDLVIQKAVELGVYEIILVKTDFSVVKWDAKQIKSKLERLQKVSQSAAMQSRRNYIPMIKGLLSFKDALSLPFDLKLFAHLGDLEPLNKVIKSDFQNKKNICVFIGSEGGFSEKEAENAKNNGFKLVSFGPNILRTETAALYALSILQYEKEGFCE